MLFVCLIVCFSTALDQTTCDDLCKVFDTREVNSGTGVKGDLSRLFYLTEFCFALVPILILL